MSTPPALFHAYLRPSILQVLRATGYHSTRPAVLDSLTDLAARYLTVLCEKTAANAINNKGDSGDYDVVDVRLALQEVGALPPEMPAAAIIARPKRTKDAYGVDEGFMGEGEDELYRHEGHEGHKEHENEDDSGVEEFVQWFAGSRMKGMMEMGSGDGESEVTDYLNALKKKHSKTGDDAKYQGTIFGRSLETASEVLVEGGSCTTISDWIAQRAIPSAPATPRRNGEHADDAEDPDSRPPSSGLSSVGDRLGDDAVDGMDLT